MTLIAGIGNGWSFARASVKVYLPPASETLSYDAAGNRSSDARWSYTWDMLDRLTSVVETAPAVAGQALKVEFKYDLLGRRTEKTVSIGAARQKKVVFQYNGSRLVREIEYSATGAQLAKRTYFWGPDVSGTPEGAAGIGGLLAIHEVKGGTLTRNLVLNDGIGNIVGLVDAATGALKASYEHGMFGEVMDVSGDRSDTSPLRWQSKYYDEETGFYYFGKRYYDPTTQSWLSRDPEREGGGMNHYAYCENRPIGNSDPLGGAMIVHSETQTTDNADSTWWAMSINGFGPDSNIFGTKSLFVQQGDAWFAELIVRREIEILRLGGVIRAVGGGVELIGGSVYTLGTGGIGGFAGGGPLILNGFDNFQAGFRTAVSGEYSPAWLESQIKSVAGDGMIGNGVYMITQIGVGAAPIAASRFASLTGDAFLPQAYARGAVLVPDRAVIVGSVELPNTRFISLGNDVGAVTSPAARGESNLIHLTDAAGESGIMTSNSLNGSHGIFAVPSYVANESTALKVARTGLMPAQTSNFVNVPEAATGLFQRPVPIGPYSAWKYFGGVRYAPLGSINISTGAFTKGSSLIGPRTLIYGPDAILYGGGAALGGYYLYNQSSQ